MIGDSAEETEEELMVEQGDGRGSATETEIDHEFSHAEKESKSSEVPTASGGYAPTKEELGYE